MTARAMTRDEIDAALHEAGVGVLSLADGGETYATPETTGVATLTVFGERPTWSVV